MRPDDPLRDAKYVVGKINPEMDADTPGEVLDPGTFFVLRQSDVFATGALFAYASSIQTALELEASMPDDISLFTSQQREDLSLYADKITRIAVAWTKTEKKIPD